MPLNFLQQILAILGIPTSTRLCADATDGGLGHLNSGIYQHFPILSFPLVVNTRYLSGYPLQAIEAGRHTLQFASQRS